MTIIQVDDISPHQSDSSFEKDSRANEYDRNKFLTIPVIAHGFTLLKKLPERLKYHACSHSQEVFDTSLSLAANDHLSFKQTLLLAIAAAYHDSGYLVREHDNEVIGTAIAREAMSRHRYPTSDIEAVEIAILDTRLKTSPSKNIRYQEPTSLLSKYLCDSDLSNLGKEEFFTKSCLLFEELYGTPFTEKQLSTKEGQDFLFNSILLMKAHSWHSAAGQALFQLQKLRNLYKLENLYAALSKRVEQRVKDSLHALRNSFERNIV